jgi:putative NADPH-quinone reductase
MKVYVVLAHPEHQSFNGAMFRTAVETFASAAAEEYCRRAAVRGRDLIEGMRRPFGAVPLP